MVIEGYDLERFGQDAKAGPERCGDCEEWRRCNIKGHEEIGWCSKWAEFFEEEDEGCD